MTHNAQNQSGTRLGAIIIVAVIIIGCVGVVAWKTGLFGSESGSPQSASASSTDKTASNDQVAGDEALSHQKIDEALDAASQYINGDRLGEAEKILEAVLAKHPKHPRVLEQVYELRLFQGNYEAAYNAIRTLLDVGTDDPEQYWMAGNIAFKLNKFTQAAAHYQQAVALDNSNPKYPLYLAQADIKLHEYEEAKIQLLRVIHLNGAVHEAFGSLAEIALIENKLDMARQNLERARQIQPDYFRWKVLEARILRREGRPDEALLRLNAITDPRLQLDDSVVEEKANCWAMLGEPEKAAEAFVAQVNAFPDAWTSALRAAEYYLIADNEIKAKTWFAYAKGRAPSDSTEIKDFAKRLGDS